MNHRGCNATKADGHPCNSSRLKDGDFCLMHSPEHAAEVAEARRLGGLRRRREVAVTGAYDIDGLENVSSIRRLIEIAALDTLGLENSVSRARTLAYLAQVALKALEVGALESRLAMVEQAVNSRVNAPESVFDIEPETTSFDPEEAAG